MITGPPLVTYLRAWTMAIQAMPQASNQAYGPFHGRAIAAVRAGTQAGPVVIEIALDGLAVARLRLATLSK